MSLGHATFELRLDTSRWDIASRPTWDQMFLAMADLVSFRGTCPARRVGAIVTVENYVVGEGYNGAPRGLRHCSDAGCAPDAHGRCTRAVHAEVNALLQAARMGSRVDGGTLYSTDRPCLSCSKAIIQAGIQRVVYWRDDLESSQRVSALETLREAGIEVICGVPFSYVRTQVDVVQ